MMKKLRTLLAAMLLVPALFSNASAFSPDSETVVSTARPGWCYVYWNGQYHLIPC